MSVIIAGPGLQLTNRVEFTKTITRKSSPAMLGYFKELFRVERLRSRGRASCNINESWMQSKRL